MAQAVEEVLGPRINKGLIVVKPGHELPLKFIRQVHGGRPVPDENSVQAAGRLAVLADEADERTLVIVLTPAEVPPSRAGRGGTGKPHPRGYPGND